SPRVGRALDRLEAEGAAGLPRQVGGYHGMGLGDVVPQFGVGEPGFGIELDPLEAARGEVGGGPEARLLTQDLERQLADLEGDEGLPRSVPAAKGEDLAADLPDVRAAPLDDVAGGRQA